jgi:hypothetical protein
MNSTILSSCKRSAVATNISVQFVFSSPLDLQIKHLMKSTRSAVAIKETDEIIPRFSSQIDFEKPAGLPKKQNGLLRKNSSSRLPMYLINTEFSLEAPMARSVKLAADFTDWDRFPLDMIRSVDGTWWTIVPLLPGEYNYRFLVDGQWCDDPRSAQCVPNPFGTSNAVVQVM